MSKKWMKMLLVVCMAFMLTITSVGGAYVSAVYAAPVDEEQISEEDTIKDKKKEQEKAALGGLLLVGLVSLMGKRGSDNNSSNDGGKNYIEPTPQGNSGSTSRSSMTAEETQLLNLINSERTKRGLAALKANNAVANVARAHSQDMIDNKYFDHTNLKGQNPFTRLRNAGISYRTAGENIAINYSVSSAHTAFMNSSGHRANVLNGEYTEVGIGIVHAGSKIYVTENFIGK